jgi:hypothetical protein
VCCGFTKATAQDLSFGLGGHETETVRLMSTKVRDPRRPHGLSMQKGKSTTSNRKDGGWASRRYGKWIQRGEVVENLKIGSVTKFD